MLVLLMGCQHPEVRAEALRGAVGYWPENSRLAVEGVAREAFAGVYLDVSLTVDGVPMLIRDAALDPSRCTRVDGTALDEPVDVASLTAEEIRFGFLCGGFPQDGFVNAVVRAEAPLTLAEGIAILRGSSATAVRLGIVDEAMVEAVLAAWLAADPPNALVLSSPHADRLAVAEGLFGAAGIDLETALVAAGSALEPSGDQAMGEGLDGVVVDAALAARRDVDRLRRRGLRVTAVAEADLPEAWDLGADVVSTPWPGDGG